MNALKRSLTFAVILIGWLAGHSEDAITFKDGRTLAASVIEITTTEVKYKKADNLNGPTYVASKSDVEQIKFENGNVDIFTSENPDTTPTTKTSATTNNIFGAPDYTGYNTNSRVSDAMLMKQYTLDRARKIKKTAKIGGCCLAVAGLATFVGFAIYAQDDNWSDESRSELYGIGGAIGGSLIIGGGTWILCANHKAKKMIESVNYLTLIEQNLISTSNGDLTAGLDVIKSHGLTPSNGIGLSFKYSF